jgi:hypothetical protein
MRLGLLLHPGLGVAAIAMHGRIPNQVCGQTPRRHRPLSLSLQLTPQLLPTGCQRPREPITEYQYETMRQAAALLTIPVIANGGSFDLRGREQMAAFRVRQGTAPQPARATGGASSGCLRAGPLWRLLSHGGARCPNQHEHLQHHR